MSLTLKSYISSNDNWGTSGFKFQDLQSLVTRIHFVAHENPDNLPGSLGEPPTNHWTLFFVTSDTTSVHVDAVPNEPGRPGMILLESERCDVTVDSVHMVSATVLGGATVERLLAVIVDRKRDNYTFAPVGEGCRYWLSVIAKDFFEEEIIDEQESDAVIEALGKYWPVPPGTPPVPRPMSKGTFNA